MIKRWLRDFNGQYATTLIYFNDDQFTYGNSTTGPWVTTIHVTMQAEILPEGADDPAVFLLDFYARMTRRS